MITGLIASCATEVSQPVESGGEVVKLTPTPASPTTVAQQNNTESKSADTLAIGCADPQLAEYRMLMSNYEALGRKLTEFKKAPVQHAPTSIATQLPPSRVESQANSYLTTDLAHIKPDNMASLRDLSFLQHREFKVHGDQVGDNTLDISYHGMCKQIDEGVMAKYTASELIRVCWIC